MAKNFEVLTEQDGNLVESQEIDDPFIRTRVVLRGWRNALRVLLRGTEIVVRVRGTHGRVYDAVMRADYTPEQPLMIGEDYPQSSLTACGRRVIAEQNPD